MPKDVILTPEGLKKLNDELELLSTEKRREVAERIREAREFGDITENSEYDDAKNEQAMVESRIAQLQERLRMATITTRLFRARKQVARELASVPDANASTTRQPQVPSIRREETRAAGVFPSRGTP